MARFFSSLNYSSVNEDWRTELAALRLTGDERVLCVTGSGARPLDLLASVPVRVLAVDRNPAQTALLLLKRAAVLALDYEEYAAFLGLRPVEPRRRLRTLWLLAPGLPVAARAFWERHEALVARGVLYQGRWEVHHARVARLVRLCWGRRVATLLGFHDAAAQRDWVALHWNDASWRLAFALACSRPVLTTLLGDPAYRPHGNQGTAARLHFRMGRLLERVLASRSFMVGLALTGRLPESDLPPHLTPAGHRVLRERLDALDFATADAREVAAGGGFDRLSLSDLGSFLETEQLGELLATISSSAPPGSRVVLREFLKRHPWPASCRALVREPELEARLALEDRSFAYDFAVAEVAGE